MHNYTPLLYNVATLFLSMSRDTARISRDTLYRKPGSLNPMELSAFYFSKKLGQSVDFYGF